MIIRDLQERVRVWSIGKKLGNEKYPPDYLFYRKSLNNWRITPVNVLILLSY
jgi:hypothetical protein